MQSKLCSFALADKLPIVKLLQFRQSGDLIDAFIVPDPFDSGKAQSEFGAVLRAMLDLIVGYLDNDLRFDREPYSHHQRSVIRLKPRGHFGKLLVGQAFECFSHRRESAIAISNGKMIVGQPTAPPTRAAISGDNCAVDRFSWFDFEPELASIARHVGAVQRFRHESFMSRGKSVFEKTLRLDALLSEVI